MKEVSQNGFPVKGFIRGAKAEILKMRHTFLFLFHGAVPLLGSVLFLIYDRMAGGSGPRQLGGFIQVTGIVLPFLISMICVGNVGLEEANHFQLLLGNPLKKWKNLGIKCIVLSGMGFLAIAGGVALFGLGERFLLGKEGVSAVLYLKLAAVLFLGSIPLYLEHLFLNLQFSKTVSQCVGVAQFLLAALFLTGLGEGRWIFFLQPGALEAVCWY